MYKSCSLSIKCADIITDFIESTRSNRLQNAINIRFNIMHKINTESKRRDDGVVSLNQKQLSKYWKVGVKQINQAITDLVFLKLLKIVSPYEIGVKPYGYISLDTDYDGSQIITCTNTATATIFSKPFHLLETNDFNKTYIRNLKNIRFPLLEIKNNKYYEYNKLYNNNLILPSNDFLLNNKLYNNNNLILPSNDFLLNNNDKIKWVNDMHWISQPRVENRIYSSITNLPKIYRDNVRWNGEEVLQTDITSAAIVLSYYKFKSETNQIDKHLEELIMNGNFYETLMDILKRKNREKLKKSFCKGFMYCNYENMKGKISNSMKDAFPLYWQWVYETKKTKGNSEFSLEYQSTEWKLIRNTLQELYKLNLPCLSLHDSIIYPKSIDYRLIETILQIESNKMFNTNIPIKSSKL